MNNLYANIDKAIDCLKSNAAELGLPEENISKGVVGIVPTASPFILIFGKPNNDYESTSENSARPIHYMELNIFAGFSNPDVNVAMEMSSTATQIAYRKLIKIFPNIKKVVFDDDAMFSDNAVNFLQIILSYTV